MQLLNVTDLSEYLFCPRKLYLKKVKGIKEPIKRCITKGSIIHHAYNFVYRGQPSVIKFISKGTSKEEVKRAFISLYYQALSRAIRHNRNDLKGLGIDPFLMFQSIWPSFIEEANESSDSIISLAGQLNAYGDELWDSITKVVPEEQLISENLGLVGRADKIEAKEEGLSIVEVKTGKPPEKGVWESQEIQAGAYIMMAKERFGEKVSNEGFIEYVESKERRAVILDDMLEKKIKTVIEAVKDIISKNFIPKAEESQKCSSCGLRDICFSENP